MSSPELLEPAVVVENPQQDLVPWAFRLHAVGAVSIRRDPMDAVEEIVFSEPVGEIIVSVANHGLSRWLHQDLAHRLEHFDLPVTAVEGPEVS